MLRRTTVGLAAAIPLLALVTPSTAVAELPPERILSVVIATINGSGCPVNTASATIIDDGKQVGIRYSDFMVSSRGPIQENCQLSLRLYIPNGWTIAVQKIVVNGEADIAAGASGVVMLTYYFQAAELSTTKTFDLPGPRSGPWTVEHEQGLGYVNWSKCGTVTGLNINTRLVMDPGTSTEVSTLSTGNTNIDYDTIFSSRFEPCA